MQPRYQHAICKYVLSLPLQLEGPHVLPEEEDLLQALREQVLPPGVASGLMRGPLFEVEVIPQLAITHVETRLAEAESGFLR